MIRVFLFQITLVCIICLSNCTSPERSNAEDGLQSLTKDELEASIKVLASDEFMGRKPFTQGETITINYLQEEFKKIGVQPGNDKSYLQEVPMFEITTDADSLMTVQHGKGSFQLKGFHDYILWTERPVEKVSFQNDELIFAGYGIVAPEYNWNDYADIDVKGKIVLVFINDPGFGMDDSTFFKGNTMTYYGRWTYKFEEAARQGAKGCLIIHDDVPASYGFWVVQNNWNASKLYLDTRGNEQDACDLVGWISLPATKKIFEAAKMNYAAKLSEAHKKGFKAEAMNLKLSTSLKAKATYNKSYNVIGKISGTKRPDEYIIYTAHWDHLGVGKADEKGDSIYNGALDNASGTAGLLALAKAFKSLKTPPERTVVFLSVTAEEQGLWGSAYYAQHPVFPKEKTVANINMDGLNWFGKTKDIVVVGHGQSDLEDYLAEEAKKVNRYVAPEPNPSAGYYFRSDHFHFAKIGIPALYTNNGIDHHEKGKEYGMTIETEYNDKFYHRPSDEYDTTRWNLEGGVEDLKLLFLVGKRLAFDTAWPQWKDNSEFKAARKDRVSNGQ